MEVQSHEHEPSHPATQQVVDAVEQLIIGKPDVVKLVMTAILAGGHCLIEDVPGVGKTMLVRAVSAALGLQFSRIQFTPDLLPSDITGITMWNQGTSTFEFRPGPIFGQVILADEINRTSPRTQSALLEAMEERTVTVDGVTHAVPCPFVVLATQNPLQMDGTFPLPEAQMDRFLMRIRVGYPSEADEVRLLDLHGGVSGPSLPMAVVSPTRVVKWQEQVRSVYVSQELKAYMVRFVQLTRENSAIYLGASPRAGLGLLTATRAWAFQEGRDFVVPDDIAELIPHVLTHRVVLHSDARVRGVTVEDVLQKLLADVPVPGVSVPTQVGGR